MRVVTDGTVEMSSSYLPQSGPEGSGAGAAVLVSPATLGAQCCSLGWRSPGCGPGVASACDGMRVLWDHKSSQGEGEDVL